MHSSMTLRARNYFNIIVNNLAKKRPKECKTEWPRNRIWRPGMKMCKFKNLLPVMNVS